MSIEKILKVTNAYDPIWSVTFNKVKKLFVIHKNGVYFGSLYPQATDYALIQSIIRTMEEECLPCPFEGCGGHCTGYDSDHWNSCCGKLDCTCFDDSK